MEKHVVMAISVISVSSDSSEDSVGTPVGRVILFGTIPTTILDTTPVISPPTTQTDTTVIPTKIPIIAPTIPPSLDYTPASPNYSRASDTESDPSEDPSSDHIPLSPATSPFLSSTNDTTDNDTPDTPSSSTHDLHSDASFDSLSTHSLSDHSSPDLSNTSPGPSRKRRRSPMAFEPYVPKEVGLGVDVEDESSEKSRSRGTDIEVNDDVERSDVIDIDPIEAVIEACFEFGDIIRASRVDVRVEDVIVAQDDVETSMRDPIVVIDGGDTPHVVPGVIPDPAQEGAVGSTSLREQGCRIIGVESTVTALTKRIAELERDNRRLRGTDPSSDHIPSLPAISPFLSSTNDTTDSDTPDTPPSPTHGTPFIEITSSTQRSLIIPRRQVMILAPGQAIPYGRLYRYHPNGSVHMMTARKRVRPSPIQQLDMRHLVDHSSSNYFFSRDHLDSSSDHH
ncbi:hypothetical protein Tco_0339452 [Tanacetum coccineum]